MELKHGLEVLGLAFGDLHFQGQARFMLLVGQGKEFTVFLASSMAVVRAVRLVARST